MRVWFSTLRSGQVKSWCAGSCASHCTFYRFLHGRANFPLTRLAENVKKLRTEILLLFQRSMQLPTGGFDVSI